jgi:hypothetical protein
MAGPLTVDGPPRSFARPPPAAAGPPPPWRLGDEEELMAELLVDAEQVQWALDALGAESVTSRRPDGSVVFAVGVTETAAFRSFVLGFLDHAEILGPPALRDEMVDWLRLMSEPASSAGARAEAPPPPAGATSSPRSPGRSSGGQDPR